jgi:hypothetical protein
MSTRWYKLRMPSRSDLGPPYMLWIPKSNLLHMLLHMMYIPDFVSLYMLWIPKSNLLHMLLHMPSNSSNHLCRCKKFQ